LRVGVDLLLPNSQASAQGAEGAMDLEALAHGIIILPEEVFAQIAQKWK
jgi:hypothetical protein